MNPPASTTLESASSSLPRRRWYWRLLRAVALLTTAFVVLVALLYGVENLRGWREWSAERERLLARGTTVEYLKFAPAPVPDAANFAQIPLLRPLYEYEATPAGTRWHDTNGYNRVMSVFRYGFPTSAREPALAKTWIRGTPTDLESWQQAFRALDEARRDGKPLPVQQPPAPLITLPPEGASSAADVLAGLAAFEDDFATLAAAIRERPQTRFAVHFEEDFSALLPHLALMKRFTGQFALRASARLAAGQRDLAFEDTRTALWLADAPRNEPYVISQLVRLACLDIALQPLWEGQTRHAWTEAQLAALQNSVAHLDPLPELRRSFDVERAAAAVVIERMTGSLSERRRYAHMFDDFSSSGVVPSPPWLECYLIAAPRGWLYASLAESSRALTLLAGVNPTNVPTLNDDWRPIKQPHSIRLVFHNTFFGGGIAGQKLSAQFIRAVRGQTHARLATAACALERHRLATGHYPDTLAALVPKFLASIPEDPVAGNALNYRRTDPDHFRLWSVGENGNDEGGEYPILVPDEWNRREPASTAPPPGDWVWNTP